ncbi:hypothetical protein DOTSEDRAFT_52958 [Dothistroma septosporum NZE10]|uniref:Uncharacterized protein n=1 Tax=Dothistroma septosporum (strain NZE10 / CBS 128990) TaxID=675120 RepID=N1PQQ2_DOTSN|nr:hypothetical protein DOTSEDRAFT_52958 [Dothistroma septosporum NZE10]
MTNVLGLPNIGLQPDTWYSIQSYATDYYIGVGNSSAISQLSSVTDSSLWQFIPGSAPASYAVRSKTSEGRYCLNPGPELQLCDSIAAQYRVFNTAEDEAASVFVPSTDRQSAALYVQGESEEGDGVETKDLEGLGGKEGGLLFEVKSPASVPCDSVLVTLKLCYGRLQQHKFGSIIVPDQHHISDPSIASSTIVITQDTSSAPTLLAGRATPMILIDTKTPSPSTSASATPGVEVSTGAGAVLKETGILIGMAASIGLWLV